MGTGPRYGPQEGGKLASEPPPVDALVPPPPPAELDLPPPPVAATTTIAAIAPAVARRATTASRRRRRRAAAAAARRRRNASSSGREPSIEPKVAQPRSPLDWDAYRHANRSIVAAGCLESHRELPLFPPHVPIELRGQGRGEAAADRRPLGDPRGEQVVAADLEPDVAPLSDVAVEPFRAESPSDDELDAAAPARLRRQPRRGERRLHRGQLARLRDHVRGSIPPCLRCPSRKEDRRGVGELLPPSPASDFQRRASQIDVGLQ